MNRPWSDLNSAPPARANIAGYPHELAYLMPEEMGMLRSMGRGIDDDWRQIRGPMGIPAFPPGSVGGGHPGGPAGRDRDGPDFGGDFGGPIGGRGVGNVADIGGAGPSIDPRGGLGGGGRAPDPFGGEGGVVADIPGIGKVTRDDAIRAALGMLMGTPMAPAMAYGAAQTLGDFSRWGQNQLGIQGTNPSGNTGPNPDIGNIRGRGDSDSWDWRVTAAMGDAGSGKGKKKDKDGKGDQEFDFYEFPSVQPIQGNPLIYGERGGEQTFFPGNRLPANVPPVYQFIPQKGGGVKGPSTTESILQGALAFGPATISVLSDFGLFEGGGGFFSDIASGIGSLF